ncbi:MAG: glutamate synthase subunit beta [Oscillospiraceae bacterium]
MGKITGFMEYDRVERPERPPLTRLEDDKEFYGDLSQRQRREQSGRCMDCGVPFCQAGIQWEGERLGCPLHNLIPEWNEMLWMGNLAHALSRLLKTNPFPEFTGRVCPAFCERACLCGRVGEPVTVRDNELAIIEYAFQNGLIQARPPQRRSGLRVGIVGSGPAGLAAAHFLNRRGHSVTVLERDPQPGGLLTYGIPSMKLDKAVVRRRLDLMEQEGIVFHTGINVGTDITPAELDENFDAVLFACGARKPRVVEYEGQAGSGVCFGLDYLIDAARSAETSSEPRFSARGKRVAIIGAGDTASDCAAVAMRQGCTDLTQIIRKPASYYSPKADYAREEAEARFGRDVRRFETKVKAVTCNEDGALTAVTLTTPQGEEVLDTDLLLVASGFSGCEEDSLAAREGMPCPEKVFSAGDMVLGASLVVLAIADGRRAAAEIDKWLMGYTNIQ